MSRTKPTAKAEEQAAEQTPKQAEEKMPASAPVEPTPVAEPASPPPPEAPATVAARVLCAGVIGGQRFEAGAVIDGLPSDVADAHAAMLDAHPSAVSHAVDGGAQVVVYEEA